MTNRQKFWAVGLAVSFAAFVLLIAMNSTRVQAQASSYTFEYNNQNFYDAYGLTYKMSGLTVGFGYEWTFEMLDDNGLVIDVIAVEGVTATATTAFIAIGDDDIPANTFAPIRVRDNFGATLSYHYVAPLPGDEWIANPATGNTAQDEKQSTGAKSSVSPCVAPPYNDSLTNGWHHTGRSCSVAVLPNGYTLLHYRMDAADYGNGWTIQFHYIEPQILDVLEFQMDEMTDYNRTGLGTAFPADELQTRNFTLLNTSGLITDLPFIDGQASAAYSVGDNPLLATMAVGAYACDREDNAGVWISDCESILLVSNASNGNEWRLDFSSGSVAPQDSQLALFGQSTSQVNDAFSGAWLFQDSEVGVLDTAIYPFTSNRVFPYVVDVPDAAVGNTAIGEWTVIPASLPTTLAQPNEMYFEAVRNSTSQFPTYLISDAEDLGPGLQRIFTLTGFDTPAGQIVVFITLVVIGSGLFWYAHFPPIIHSVWYLAVGGFILVVVFGADSGTGLFTLLFGVTAPLVVLFGIMGQQQSSGGELS